MVRFSHIQVVSKVINHPQLRRSTTSFVVQILINQILLRSLAYCRRLISLLCLTTHDLDISLQSGKDPQINQFTSWRLAIFFLFFFICPFLSFFLSSFLSSFLASFPSPSPFPPSIRPHTRSIFGHLYTCSSSFPLRNRFLHLLYFCCVVCVCVSFHPQWLSLTTLCTVNPAEWLIQLNSNMNNDFLTHTILRLAL